MMERNRAYPSTERPELANRQGRSSSSRVCGPAYQSLRLSSEPTDVVCPLTATSYSGLNTEYSVRTNNPRGTEKPAQIEWCVA